MLLVYLEEGPRALCIHKLLMAEIDEVIIHDCTFMYGIFPGEFPRGNPEPASDWSG